MQKATNAIKLLAQSAGSFETLNIAQLIQARVDEILRPNYDLITFPRLGDMKCVGDDIGIRRGQIIGNCCAQSSIQDDPCLQMRGIFRLYDEVNSKMGYHSTNRAWGLSRQGQWLNIQIPIVKQQRARGWEEKVSHVHVQEVTLEQLLEKMMAARNLGKKTDGGSTLIYTDDLDAVHYIHAYPSSIWYEIHRFILKWHREQRKKYLRSKRFADMILREEFAIEQLHSIFPELTE